MSQGFYFYTNTVTGSRTCYVAFNDLHVLFFGPMKGQIPHADRKLTEKMSDSHA